MATYSEEKYFFERFVEEAEKVSTSSGERKLLNLIKKHFDILAPIGTGGGKRARKLNELIQEEGLMIGDVIESKEKDSATKMFPFKHLHSIAIEAFRGFSSLETIDLSKKYIFIYGPNGSGKTSFFEALEYSLLGELLEANARRMNITSYLKNRNKGIFRSPILLVEDYEGKPVQIVSSRSEYQFCFIEKNRIENFGKISSHTRESQENLLATLFGLDSFNKFVGEFTDGIERYIDIVGKKAKDLTEKERSIEAHNINYQTAQQNLKEIEKQKREIIDKVGFSGSFIELIEYINGTADNIGRIKQLDQELERPISHQKIEIKKPEVILSNIKAIFEKKREYLELLQSFQEQNNKVSFRNLYEAIINLRPLMKDRCPACQTSIKRGFLGLRQTKINPYIAAEKGLKELESVALLQQKVKQARKTIIDEMLLLMANIEVFAIYEKDSLLNNGFSNYHTQVSTDDISDTDLFAILDRIDNTLKTNKNIYDKIIEEIEASNKESINSELYRSKMKVEKDNLAQANVEITKVQTLENTYNQQANTSQAFIDKFKEDNAVLITEVESERAQIGINKTYVEAYKSLMVRLTSFKNELPSRWVKDLGKYVKEIYNIINYNDDNTELIEDIVLPQNADEKITIAFQDKPSDYIDALYILSEGHLRCLGLAILLAKNVTEQKPLVVFDDVVNAIDDDHRSGIRKLLFEYEKLKDKQLVLTSHSEEFIKDIELDIAANNYDELVNKLTFLKATNRQIRILEKNAFNYLRKAKDSLDSENKRDALASCRRALENLTDVLWKRLSNKYNTTISVAIRQPASRPELMSVVSGLRGFIEKNASESKFKDFIPTLTYFEGLQTKSKVVWNILNKGTHEEEDREDFDKAIVEELYTQLIELDSNLKS